MRILLGFGGNIVRIKLRQKLFSYVILEYLTKTNKV